MASTDPLGIPEIQDKRTKPSGLLPKNAQTWALAAVAVVMVLVIMFSGRTAPKQASKTTVLPIGSDSRPPNIDDIRRRIDEMTIKNRAEQQRILALQAGITHPPVPPTNEPLHPGSTPPPAYAGRGYAYAYGDVSPERTRADPEEQKRESRAPFASNIALSYRKQDQPIAQDLYHADARSPETSSGDGAGEPTFSGAGKPQRGAAGSDQDKEQHTESDSARKAQPTLPHRPGEIDYPIFEGTVLETVLTNRLDGYFSGPINCMLTTDVYSPNGAQVLIPSGSRVLGEVKRVDTFGQQRLAVVFHRLIMPDGYSVVLDQFKGLNEIGETGLLDQVNHHYLQLFGVSIAIGAIAGLAQSNTNYGTNVTGAQAYEQGAANSLSQTSLHILDRYLNVLPTITIREGNRVKVYLTQDLMLPAYDKHAPEADLNTQQTGDNSQSKRKEQEK